MQTQEVAIKPTVKVVLTSDAQSLEEVVVVAYGTDSATPADVPTIQMHQNGKDGLGKEGVSPMVMIDDTEVSTETMKKLDPENIESFFVLKDVSATAKYGQKGKNGVILITTRKK